MNCDISRTIGFATEVSCQQVKCKRQTMKHNRPKDLVLKVSVLLLLLFCVFVFLVGGVVRVYNYGLLIP